MKFAYVEAVDEGERDHREREREAEQVHRFLGHNQEGKVRVGVDLLEHIRTDMECNKLLEAARTAPTG